jgi:1,2-diacylglycerol-3-alpha-glucose alpha-1,2-galactosyltransferase
VIVHVVSETAFVVKGTGVHTAFIDHVKLLKRMGDVQVVVNNEGTGDVFHSHTYLLYYFWKGRKYKGRRVFTVHVIPDSAIGSIPAWKLLMPFIRWWLKITYSYADVCIAISPMVEKAVMKSGARTRIVRIDNPILRDIWERSDERRKEGRRMLGLKDDDFVVLGVGQLMGSKGIDDFISIAKAVDEAKFVWAGGRPMGGMTEGLIRITEKLRRAGNRFISAGQIDHEKMPHIYAAADLMLFPSFHENCPLAPLEAAASGLPVIFRDIEEYKSLYENPYLKAGNLEEFIALTKRMITDKDYYNEGVTISDRLLDQFDKDIIREKYIEVYKSLIDNDAK